MRKISAALLLMAFSVPLGGCKSFVSAFDFGGRAATPASPSPIFGAADLEQGKSELRAGHTGNAIRALQLATLNPATAAEAFNALGIAYARLGRADLAEKHFKIAMATDPRAKRFSDNLARFYASDLGQHQFALAERLKATSERSAIKPNGPNFAQLLGDAPAFERRGALVLEKPQVRILRPTTGAVAIRTVEGTGEPSTIEVASRRETMLNSQAAQSQDASRPVITLLRRSAGSAITAAANPPIFPARVTISSSANRASRPSTRPIHKPPYPARVAIRTNGSK